MEPFILGSLILSSLSVAVLTARGVLGIVLHVMAQPGTADSRTPHRNTAP